jgi:ubiquinone/menaquinone biosynthesis C-methylase UbiE
MKTDKKMLKYYSKGAERTRLYHGAFRLERVRSQEIIRRYLPKKKKPKILDIGGGCGFYSFWLKKLGHEVYLVDVVEKNIEIARAAARKKNTRLACIEVGDARDLRFADACFDAVLMMGPLYHLTGKKDRMLALREAHRVLKRGGLLFAAAISRYAWMMDTFYYGLEKDPDCVRIMDHDLINGQHRNYTKKFNYFTTAFLTLPDALRKEVKASGFGKVEIIAIEAFGAHVPGFNRNWHDPKFMRLLLKTIDKVEKDSSLLGMSNHIMAVARKK